jgi:hypothetical protein
MAFWIIRGIVHIGCCSEFSDTPDRRICPMAKRVSAWIVVLLSVSLIGLDSCSSRDEETAVRELVKKGATLAEEQEIGGLMKLTTEDFLALPGELGRQETRRILFLAFRHYRDFKILYPRPSVELKPDKHSASAVFPFLIVKKETVFPKLKELYEDPQRWLDAVGENADLYRFKLECAKQNGEWLVKQARVERFTGISFSE